MLTGMEPDRHGQLDIMPVCLLETLTRLLHTSLREKILISFSELKAGVFPFTPTTCICRSVGKRKVDMFGGSTSLGPQGLKGTRFDMRVIALRSFVRQIDPPWTSPFLS